MPWLFLLLALAAFAVAFKSSSMALAVVSLLAALGFVLAWVLGLLAQRVGSQSRDDSQMLDPQELRRLREQAEARRASADASDEPPAP
jgi:Mg2+/Co2+ transporter CorB